MLESLLPTPISYQLRRLAMYLDGAPFTKDDSFIGFVVYNLLTQRRHLVALLRKSELCACGCSGWCSFFVVFQFLHHSFMALREKRMPLGRSDREPWSELDCLWRAGVAGAELRARGMLLYIKGDWAEMSHTVGFPAWNSVKHCCLFCDCVKDTMLDFHDVSLVDLPWNEHEYDAYEEACKPCEIDVIVATREDLTDIRSSLHYDKRQHGFHGRALLEDLPKYGLLKGDRSAHQLKLLRVIRMSTG